MVIGYRSWGTTFRNSVSQVYVSYYDVTDVDTTRT